jgi:CopG family transcriptional regulator/antitoxin EndoAI
MDFNPAAPDGGTVRRPEAGSGAGFGIGFTSVVCRLQVSQPFANPVNKRIDIVLPEKTVGVLDRVTRKGARSRFMDRAVLHYVETQGRQNLRERLKEGYRVNAKRDLDIAAGWFPLEEGAWKAFENSSESKKLTKPKRA